jgi:hypothetical protein
MRMNPPSQSWITKPEKKTTLEKKVFPLYVFGPSFIMLSLLLNASFQHPIKETRKSPEPEPEPEPEPVPKNGTILDFMRTDMRDPWTQWVLRLKPRRISLYQTVCYGVNTEQWIQSRIQQMKRSSTSRTTCIRCIPSSTWCIARATVRHRTDQSYRLFLHGPFGSLPFSIYQPGVYYQGRCLRTWERTSSRIRYLLLVPCEGKTLWIPKEVDSRRYNYFVYHSGIQ